MYHGGKRHARATAATKYATPLVSDQAPQANCAGISSRWISRSTVPWDGMACMLY